MISDRRDDIPALLWPWITFQIIAPRENLQQNEFTSFGEMVDLYAA